MPYTDLIKKIDTFKPKLQEIAEAKANKQMKGALGGMV